MTERIAARRAAARWRMRAGIAERIARARALRDLAHLHHAADCGRRLELVADDLRTIAGRLDCIPRDLAEAS